MAGRARTGTSWGIISRKAKLGGMGRGRAGLCGDSGDWRRKHGEGNEPAWISGFDDFLPLCALSLLWISFGLLFALASRTIRVRLLGRNSSILCVAVIMVYIIVAGFSFGSMALGDL